MVKANDSENFISMSTLSSVHAPIAILLEI